MRQLRREARTDPLYAHGALLDCAVQLGHKAPLYALLAGEQRRALVALHMHCSVEDGVMQAHRPWLPCSWLHVAPFAAHCKAGPLR